MIAMGACAAVIDNGKILLTKREDFEVWCLPGGHVENGESMAQAAVRETLEETGLVVELSHLVSISYRQHNWNGLPMHLGCFAARRTGGQLLRRLGMAGMKGVELVEAENEACQPQTAAILAEIERHLARVVDGLEIVVERERDVAVIREAQATLSILSQGFHQLLDHLLDLRD